jgi:hypothetical protein
LFVAMLHHTKFVDEQQCLLSYSFLLIWHTHAACITSFQYRDKVVIADLWYSIVIRYETETSTNIFPWYFSWPPRNVHIHNGWVTHNDFRGIHVALHYLYITQSLSLTLGEQKKNRTQDRHVMSCTQINHKWEGRCSPKQGPQDNLLTLCCSLNSLFA